MHHKKKHAIPQSQPQKSRHPPRAARERTLKKHNASACIGNQLVYNTREICMLLPGRGKLFLLRNRSDAHRVTTSCWGPTKKVALSFFRGSKLALLFVLSSSLSSHKKQILHTQALPSSAGFRGGGGDRHEGPEYPPSRPGLSCALPPAENKSP